MSPTRVLRVIARMNVGGPARQVSALADALPSLGYRQLLATGLCAPDEQDFLEVTDDPIEHVRIEHLGRALHPVRDALAYRDLRRIARHFSPDVVHTHTFKAGLLGRLPLGIAPDAAVVHTFHGHLLHGYYGPVVSRGIARLEALLARRTDAVIAVGSRVREELLAAGVGAPESTFACRPGVHPIASTEVETARRHFGIEKDTKVVLWIGRFSPVKDPMRALEVLAATLRRVDDVVMIMAGDGELRASVQARAAAQNLDVRFPGWVSDVSPLLAVGDAMILTSLNEGVPISLIEAASHGVPAVSTDVGSVRDIPGVRVVESAAQHVDELVDLLESGPAASHVDPAGVEALFGPAALADRMHEIYQWVLGHGPRPQPELHHPQPGE